MTELTRETMPDGGPEMPDPAVLQAIRPSASLMAAAEEAFVRLRWLSEANQADGFPQPEYVSIGHAPVRVAREMSGTRWSTTAGSAWIRFFVWLQPHLRGGAPREAAPQQVIVPSQEAARRAAAHADAGASGLAGLFNGGGEPAPAVDPLTLGMTVPHQDE